MKKTGFELKECLVLDSSSVTMYVPKTIKYKACKMLLSTIKNVKQHLNHELLEIGFPFQQSRHYLFI